MSILSTVMGVTQETVNHRRLVQDVYDMHVLHRMAGVGHPGPSRTSTPPSFRARTNGSGRSHKAEASIKAAWEEVDMNSESGEERSGRPLAGNEDEDESRYDIRDKKQPPKKRRRVGSQKDMHTIYTSDEDEDDNSGAVRGDERLVVHAELGESELDSSNETGSNSVTDEEAEYDTATMDDKAKRAERRSYWLSKGITTS